MDAQTRRSVCLSIKKKQTSAEDDVALKKPTIAALKTSSPVEELGMPGSDPNKPMDSKCEVAKPRLPKIPRDDRQPKGSISTLTASPELKAQLTRR